MNIVTSAHPFADLLGLSVDSKQSGKSTCSIAFTERLLNPNNVVHGGVIYSMADTGMGGALMSLLGDGQLCATIEIKMMYLKPAGHHDLVCNTEVIKQGRRVAILESEVFSGGELIAKATGSFAVFET
jgi:acyl-CoA thioesterase